MKFVDRDLQLHEPLCLPIQTKFFCFADESQKKPYIKVFVHKNFPDRARKSGHRTFHNILHKKDKMAYTVPRFDPHIHLVGKEKNNEEGEIDVISWRKNVSTQHKRQ